MSDLPVETELIDGEWYKNSETRFIGRWIAKPRYFFGMYGAGSFLDGKGTWQRLGPIAEYRPAPTEPKGLGAVVKDPSGQVWLRAFGETPTPWYSVGTYSYDRPWDSIPQPVEVLAEGWVAE